MIFDSPDTINLIREFINKKKKENKLPDRPVREDIFEILSRECIVLYYPLDDEKIKGCHIEKVLRDEIKQFVFINTIKSSLEQTWTAAHELGHVWSIDKYINDHNPENKDSSEDIVNRFASEILFPEEEFKKEVRFSLEEIGISGNKMNINQFIKLITYLMNYFAAPYKAIIKRLVEIRFFKKSNMYRFIDIFENNLDYHRKVVEANYYTRINNTHSIYSMEGIGNDIDTLEKRGLIKENQANAYRKMFNVSRDTDSEGFLEIGDDNGTGE